MSIKVKYKDTTVICSAGGGHGGGIQATVLSKRDVGGGTCEGRGRYVPPSHTHTHLYNAS